MFPPEVWNNIVQYCDVKTLRVLMYTCYDTVGEARRELNSIHCNLKDLHKRYVAIFTQYHTIDFKPVEVLIKEWGIMRYPYIGCILQYMAFICKMWPNPWIDGCCQIRLKPNYGTAQIQIVSEYPRSCQIIINTIRFTSCGNMVLLRHKRHPTNQSLSPFRSVGYEGCEVIATLIEYLQLFCKEFDYNFKML